MPTNIIRNAPRKGQPAPVDSGATAVRVILLTAGAVTIRAALVASPTADRLWAALPLHATAETWGASIRIEVPIESGRERNARLLGSIGEIYYWSEDDRIIVPFGPTPISRPKEIRLPSPCNLLARTADDVTLLKAVTPGQKASIRRD